MDDTLFSSSSAFEDVVFPYDLDVLSFFDLSRDDGASENADAPQLDGGNSISAMDFASFVLGDIKDEEMSEPDFATSVSSESPLSGHPQTPTSSSQVVDTASLVTSDINCLYQSSNDAESDMSTLNTPTDSNVMPQTPGPISDYLPSPPITPICKRSAAVKLDETPQSDYNIWKEPSQPIVHGEVVPAPAQVKRRPSPRAKKSPRLTKPRSKTPATAKLSIRRKLLESHPIAKRKYPAKFRPASPSKSTPRMGKVKIKLEFNTAEIQKSFVTHDIPLSTQPRKSVSASKPRGRVCISKKAPKRPVKGVVGKIKTKGRMTNNSLSSTLHPTIIKRKGQKARTYSVGKICNSYYPSNASLVPHSAGERYHKGKPGKCAREDCKGDSLATVTRHCISEYLQKGARGSSIPRPLRLHWCNKCYMRHRADSDYYPRLFSMILDQLEYVAEDGNGEKELFHVEIGKSHQIVELERAKEYVVEYWRKFETKGSQGRFKVVPIRF